jgi:hypothetical protein
MRTECVAVKSGEVWNYYDPSSRYAAFGMLRWDSEGQPALVSDPKEPLWTATPLAPAARSTQKRAATMKLLPDGTLEGTVRIEYSGHIGANYKEYNDEDSQQQREETLKNIVQRDILSTAEITDIRIENIDDSSKPFVYSFKLRVPGYASRTGKRLFLQPNIFERSAKPMFSAGTRRYDIYFQYPYSERDQVFIDLPEGFEPESPDSPGTIKDKSGIGVDEIKLFVGKENKSITYLRNFTFGNGGVLTFDKSVYPQLKSLFDTFHKADSHQITIKESAGTAGAN